MTHSLTDKVAIVTGGATGIGRACVEALHAAEAKVVVADVDDVEGLELAKTLGPSVAFIKTDVCQMDQMQAMADFAVSKFGGVDILVNNAARAINGVVDEIDEDRWTTVINTNLTGYWRAMRVCVPIMRKRGGGSIVNMSSVQGCARSGAGPHTLLPRAESTRSPCKPPWISPLRAYASTPLHLVRS